MEFEFGKLIINPLNNLESTIEDMDLSVRSYSCLERAGIRLVSELANNHKEDLLKLKGMGKKSFKEINTKMRKLGFNLLP